MKMVVSPLRRRRATGPSAPVWRLHRRKHEGRSQRREGNAAAGDQRGSSWPARIAVAGAGVIVLGGGAILLVFLFGRPRVTITQSGAGLFHISLGGWGTRLGGVTVTSSGKPVALAFHAGEIMPRSRLSQGQDLEVTASAAPASSLRWLLGGRVTAREIIRTPSTSLTATAVVSSQPGKVSVSFTHPVTEVAYEPAGGAEHMVRLMNASDVATLTVPPTAAAGTLAVRAAPASWEHLSAEPSTVTWFAAPHGSGAVALARPAPGATNATSNGPITLTFAQPVERVLGSTRPTVTPAVAGRWTEPAANTLVFTPTGFGFGPGTTVKVSFDRPVEVVGNDAAAPAGATTTAASSTYRFRVAAGSVLRLEQILAQLGYLPLHFVPASGVTQPKTFAEEVPTMTRPLSGNFTWRWSSTPSTLRSQWSVGSPNVLLRGALMAFDANQGHYDGYQVDGMTLAELANATTWKELLQAAADGKVDPNPYSYVYVTQTLPETLTLWQNGSILLTARANTGIPASPTADGTFPIYVRYKFNYMSGFNPDGSYYHDPVYWINYFNGGDAVHGFVRSSYGYPQSLGCVELPVSTAQVAFHDLTIGDLVTVAG